MQMLNYLVRRLSMNSFQRLKNVRFGIFPQRCSNEFQVFNVFHNRRNCLMRSSSFFQSLVMGFGVHFLLFAGIGWPQGTFSSNGVSLPTRFSTAIHSRAEGGFWRGWWSVLHARSPPGLPKAPSLDEGDSTLPATSEIPFFDFSYAGSFEPPKRRLH